MPLHRGLQHRTADWVEAGILSADQRQQLLEFEGAAGGRNLRGRLIAILAVIGAALVVLGLVLVISQNWDEAGKPPKLIVGITVLLACYGGGYWLSHGPLGLTRSGEGLLLIGTGAFLGNLALISQQYQFAFNPAPLLLAVLCVAIAFAYLFSSRTYAFVAAVILVSWLIMEVQRAGSPLESGADTLLLLLVGAGAWLLVLAGLQRGSAYVRLSPPVELVGGLLIVSSVYLLGFYRHFDIADGVPIVPVLLLLYAPMGLIVAAALATGVRAEARLGWPRIHESLRAPLLFGQLTLLALLVITLAAALNPPLAYAERAPTLTTLGYWVGACLLTGSIIWLGLALRRESWVNAALVFLGLFIVTRYFDLISDYARTGGLFVGAGLLCLVLAFLLEFSRRRLGRGMAAPEGGAQAGA